MPRRPSHDGRGLSQQQKKLLVALSFFLLPWLQTADALQQQKQQQRQHQHGSHAVVPQAGLSGEDISADNLYWESAAVKPRPIIAETPNNDNEGLTPREQYHNQQQQQSQQNTRRSLKKNTKNNINEKKDPSNQYIPIPDDASALATSALASLAVRAPSPLRQWPDSHLADGPVSPQTARSLEDWEVEDFVLLATVDGDLFANDRKTGTTRWHLNIDQPMVESIHHRASTSVVDEDYRPVDHFIWAIEPTRDGGIYIWTPEPDSSPRHTGLSMKQLVELSPYEDEHTSIVYVGTKKTTMITIDAGTGRILKYFGPDVSQSNEAESCLRPSALFDKSSEECSSTGTITLGRTEYSVTISRKDGKKIATLKYSEWTPNTRDSDLSHQYHASKDSRYITTQHDGKVYAFDYARADRIGPMFSQKFNVPVARVFDVCRPGDAAADSNPHLVVLPQPAMPSRDEDMAQKRSNSVFFNCTEEGSWYALSGVAYPLIIGAPPAKASMASWWDQTPSWDSLTEAKVSKALVGTHSLGNMRRRVGYIPTLPGRQFSNEVVDPDNLSALPNEKQSEFEQPTMADKVKGLPQSAADSVVEFVRNPIPLIIIFIALIYNIKKLGASYRRFRSGRSLRDAFLYPDSNAGRKALRKAEKSVKFDISEISTQSPVSKKDDSATSLDVPGVDQPGKVAVVSGEDCTSLQATIKKDLDIGGDDVDNNKNDERNKTAQSSDPVSDDLKNEERRSSLDGDPSSAAANAATPEKKRARRGRRAGVKHRRGRYGGAPQSRDDEASGGTVDDAVNNAKRLGDNTSFEADVVTVASDMQAISGSVIRMGSIEVNTDEHLGTGSNGTLVFGGRFDGREVAVKRMLIQFYDIALRETNLLRESDDHPNGKRTRLAPPKP